MGFIGRTATRDRRVKGLRTVVLGVILIAAVACSPVFRNHGYVPSDEELAQVEVGKDTRDTVEAKIGRPSAQGLLNDVGWFYVQSRWKERGGLAPLEIDRQVLAVTFNSKGTVDNIERFGLEKGRVVPISRRVTKSNIKGIGLVAQLLGNFGRIGPGILSGK